MIKSNRGFSLIHVLVGSTLAIGGAFLASMAFTSLFRSQMNERRLAGSQAASGELALFLKTHLGGTRSLQNVRFRVPNAPGGATNFQSQGPGIYVLPNTDVNGANAPGNDSLFIVSRIKDPVELSLNAAVIPGAPIQVSANNAALLPAGFFRNGEYVAISRVQRSDVFRVTATALPTPTRVDLTSDLTSASSPTFNPPPDLSTLYVSGDFIYRIEIFQIGIDSSTGAIRARNMRDNSFVQLVPTATQFSVGYQIVNCTIGTTTLSTPAGTFARDQWAFINGDPNCYANISQIQITSQVPPRGPTQLSFPVN